MNDWINFGKMKTKFESQLKYMFITDPKNDFL